MHVLVVDDSGERAEGVSATLRKAGYEVTVIVSPSDDVLALLAAEVQALKLKLAERKLVERAKGLLMKWEGVDEETAYAALRKMAMDRNLKLAEVASRVIDADEFGVRVETRLPVRADKSRP
jgi:CheY-like chemotaxis protein